MATTNLSTYRNRPMSPTLTFEQELDAFCHWNPPILTLGPKSSKPKASRGLSFYDKHLAKNVVLKHVKSLPTLVTALASVVDAQLRNILARDIELPSLKTFPTLSTREAHLQTTVMKSENKVAEFYSRSTAQPCMQVASTLALHPGSRRWVPILQWSSTPSSSGYAIADGSLQILESTSPASPVEQDCWESMDDDIRKVMLKVKHLFPDLATWEIRSLSVGSMDVMQGILQVCLEAVFPWEHCDGRPACRRGHKTIDVSVGPDANNTPWTIDTDPDSRGESSMARQPPTMEGLAEGSSQSLPSNISSEIWQDIFGGDLSPSATSGEDMPLPVKDWKGKGRGQCRNRGGRRSPQKTKGKRKRENVDQNHATELTAQRFLQHAWVQAVRSNTSLIILHSGNYEHICVRHRESQTLYVSNLIHVETCMNPAYGKLQLGLYIAALQDAMDRTKQIIDAEDGNTSSPLPGYPGSQKPLDDGPDSNGKPDETKRKYRKFIHGDQEDENSQDSGQNSCKERNTTGENTCFIEASTRTLALLYLRYGIYDSPVPASFSRSRPSLFLHTVGPTPRPSPNSRNKYSDEDCFALILTSEMGHGANGVVHGATLQLLSADGRTLSHEVVVKLAFSNEQRESLRHEYDMYRHLVDRGLPGLATLLGLFDDLEGCASALVMTYKGVDLGKEQSLLSHVECTSFISKLKDIHDAGLLHGDLRPQNLLIDEFGDATIIDFGHARKSSSRSMMDTELAQLSEILVKECG